jgi:hypothetical protein
MQLPTHRSGRLPIYILAAAALQATWLFWLWWHGVPRLTSDSVCFKQPAYMRLHTPHFSVPTYEGLAPYWQQFNSYPAVLYYYVNYAVFSLFGFSLWTTLGVDFVIHFMLATLAAVGMWRITERQLPASVLLLTMFPLLSPTGRPEKLGMVLILIALYVLRRETWGIWLSALLLGLTAVTTPGAAIVGGVLLIIYDACLSAKWSDWLKRCTILATVSGLVAFLIYGDYIGWRWADAWEQNRVLFVEKVYTTQSLLATAASDPMWIVGTLPVIAAAFVVGLYFLIWRREWLADSPHIRALVVAATTTIGVGFVLNVATNRLSYDYRHITTLSLMLLILLISARASQRSFYSARGLGLLGLLLVLAAGSNLDLARYTIVPLANEQDHVSYQQAQASVKQLVPPNASVGGDGYLWTLVDDGRPFRSIWGVTEIPWPDYLIFGTRGAMLTSQSDAAEAPVLKREYEEITPLPLLPQTGTYLNLAGFSIPLSRGRCDWYVRVFRRLDAKRTHISEPAN